MRDVAILQDTVASFVAEQPPFRPGPLVLIPILIVGFIVVSSLRSRDWKLAAAFGASALFLGGLALYFASGVTYRMTLDRDTGEIHTAKISHGKPSMEDTIHRNEIASVEMQFDRGDRRIALVLKNGQVLFPLGSEYIQDEPKQYQVLNALRKAIGQTTTPSP